MAFFACNKNAGSGRNPQGNAVEADVLSGKTFSNANSDNLTGAMADYSGSNRRTIAVDAGTGTQTINLSAGYHDSVTVDRTAAYNAGADSVKNTEWGEPINICYIGSNVAIGYSDTSGGTYRLDIKHNVGISCKNATKLVKDAIWQDANNMFSIGLYTQMNGWENGQGSYVKYTLPNITTLTFSGSTYPGLLITGSSSYNTYSGGYIASNEITVDTQVVGYIEPQGTAYLTLWRKGIGT